MSYGQDIFNQLQQSRAITLSWGASAFKTFRSEHFNKDLAHRGGLLFKVRGHHHKGHVMIRVKGNDTYHIQFGRLHKGDFIPSKTKESLDDIYCEDFVNLIDEQVEKISSYVF